MQIELVKINKIKYRNGNQRTRMEYKIGDYYVTINNFCDITDIKTTFCGKYGSPEFVYLNQNVFYDFSKIDLLDNEVIDNLINNLTQAKIIRKYIIENIDELKTGYIVKDFISS